MWGEILTTEEVEYCQSLVDRLRAVDWAAPLLARIAAVDRLSYVHKPLLFELRFAGDLANLRLSTRYEAPTGIDGTTVDFEVMVGGVRWRFELVSVLTSDALSAATWNDGFMFGATLSTGGNDQRQSVEGELLLTQQKVGEKAFDGRRPVKFPTPESQDRNIIVVDTRGMGITGADQYDCLEIAYGHAGIHTPFGHFWRIADGSLVPIKGIFDPTNNVQRAVPTVRDRIHAIAFSNNDTQANGALIRELLYCPNPGKFSSHVDAIEALMGVLCSPNQVAMAPSALRSD